MSPRKSSTSSGNRFDRPRYLLVEVSGTGTLSPSLLERLLAARVPEPHFRFRVIRVDGPFGLVAVEHTDAPAARTAWNGAVAPGLPSIRTLRSYGTLRKGKIWVAARLRPGAAGPR